MSWLADLYQTYENNLDQVGKPIRNNWGKEVILLPISHAYQNAQIEVIIKPTGEFYKAKVIPKEEAATMIPVTIESAGRTSKPMPHGLHDNLQYVAGDYIQYGGDAKKGESFQKYIANLERWCASDFSHPKVQAILTYLKRGTLITDLINYQDEESHQPILIEREGKLVAKWKKEFGEKPEIFSVLASDQFSSFVRFDIYDLNLDAVPVWKDLAISKAFIDYYTTQLSGGGLDYITGKQVPLTENHPSKIRYGGDMAKLISGNDTINFTFRGRFSEKNQVATIGYETSQKGHNALKWLISKQGKIIDGRVFLTWGEDSVDNLPAIDESSDAIFAEDKETDSITTIDKTSQDFSKSFIKALQGYQQDLRHDQNIHIMILDSATPGRMGILYYRSMEQESYLERLKNWHNQTGWWHAAGWQNAFYGAPSLRTIAEAVHGRKASETLIKNTMTQLFSCVVDNRKMPFNIMQSLLKNASNPLSMELWEWRKTVGIACSIIKHYFYDLGEEYTVALNKEGKDRSYLFGRLLAVADKAEDLALFIQYGEKNKKKQDNDNGKEKNKDKKERTTNALRYMNAFSNHPVTTWKILQENLIPYYEKLEDKGNYYQNLINQIMTQFDINDYTDRALTGKYLLGYSSQRIELNNKDKNKDKEEK
ncbi:type I-C CRISPR-associated protein Cas8c/Csd1 [Melissococcus plutonius]|uniref:type I-C CRISPR-associated protein Cas8c/Csd1 n=1 Tax=Melissococcus plutonius TaxID=33970 RepID=UPI003EE75233